MKCEQEMCPFWSGSGCVREAVDIGPTDRNLARSASEGWAAYAAEQERHAETTAARDAHFEARNLLGAKADRLEERLAAVLELAATIDGARARLVERERMHPISDALKDIRTHNGQSLSSTNLRWAATHEALCRSFIFDVLTGLADALEQEECADA